MLHGAGLQPVIIIKKVEETAVGHGSAGVTGDASFSLIGMD